MKTNEKEELEKGKIYLSKILLQSLNMNFVVFYGHGWKFCNFVFGFEWIGIFSSSMLQKSDFGPENL